jgi:hypothetical protein
VISGWACAGLCVAALVAGGMLGLFIGAALATAGFEARLQEARERAKQEADTW